MKKIYPLFYCSLFLLFGFTQSCNGSTSPLPHTETDTLLLDSSRFCAYSTEYGSQTINFATQQEADSIMLVQVEELFIAAGLYWNQANKYVYVFSNTGVNNCKAYSIPLVPTNIARGYVRNIAYNPAFVESVRQKTGSAFAITSILAHELAHHLYGHLEQANPNRLMQELQADYFSGFMLAKMRRKGLSLEEALLSLRMFGDSLATATHPDRETRIQYFTNGWEYAVLLDSYTCGQLNNYLDQPETFIRNVEASGGSRLIDHFKQEVQNNITPERKAYMQELLSADGSMEAKQITAGQKALLIIPHDTNLYVMQKDSSVFAFDQSLKLLNTDAVMMFAKSNQPVLRANKSTADNEQFRENMLYLDKHSFIWSRLPNGIPHVIGIKQALK